MNEQEHEDEPHLDEILNEILWRAYELKKKAERIQQEPKLKDQIKSWFTK